MTIYTPLELEAEVARRALALGSARFVAAGENKRPREMWCAGRFGTGFANNYDEACKIDIEEKDEQRDYDFRLLTAGASLDFQLVEVLEHDRRRGDEYWARERSGTGALLDDRPLKTREYACEHIALRLDNKMKRLGPSGTLHMLLYLNLNVPDLPWASMSSAAEPFARSFASIWIFSQYFVACLAGGTRWAGATGWKSIDLMG